MVEFLRRLGRFLNEMDAKAITSFAVSIILLVFVVLMFLFGKGWLNLQEDGAVMDLMARAADSPWALVGVISVFSLLALTAFPQILLITVTVIAFGPKTGALYAWIATMASATLTFGMGHFLGGRWVLRLGGERVQKRSVSSAVTGFWRADWCGWCRRLRLSWSMRRQGRRISQCGSSGLAQGSALSRKSWWLRFWAHLRLRLRS